MPLALLTARETVPFSTQPDVVQYSRDVQKKPPSKLRVAPVQCFQMYLCLIINP